MFTRNRFLLYSLMLVALFALASCGSDDEVVIPPDDGWPDPDPVTIDVPGFPPMPVPPDNPLTKQGIALGRMLFYDPILSGDSTQACADCHQFGRSFSDTLRFSVGIDGSVGGRNAPHIVNPAYLPVAFWDGRVPSLENQAEMPVANPIEMKSDWNDVVAKLQSHPEYPDMFGRAFGTDVVTKDLTVKAIAQFERTFVSYQSKFDKWLETRDWQQAGFTAAQERGRMIFDSERGDCFHCHRVNVLLTDNDFHNVGIDSPLVDLGAGDITGNPDDFGKFKTPSLRNVEVTAPYMHDGRFTTLRQVVEHYNSGGFETETLDPLLRKRGVGLGLTDAEMDDLVEFLKTFTDPVFLNNPDLDNPFQ